MEISHSPETGLTIDEEAMAWFKKKLRSMSPAQKRRFVKKGLAGLGMFEGILWMMCRDDIDPHRATLSLVEKLKTGELVMQADRKSANG